MKSPNRRKRKSGLMEREPISCAIAESLSEIARRVRGNSAMNQRERIMEGLKNHGALTTIEMRRHLDVMSPASRILELKRAGNPIEMKWVNQATDCGKMHRVALYVLEIKA